MNKHDMRGLDLDVINDYRSRPQLGSELDRLRALNAELRDFIQEYVNRFGAKHADEVDSPMVVKARAVLDKG